MFVISFTSQLLSVGKHPGFNVSPGLYNMAEADVAIKKIEKIITAKTDVFVLKKLDFFLFMSFCRTDIF